MLTLWKLNKLHKEHNMKKRVTIYVEESVWEVAQDAARQRSAAEKKSVSASQVVENCILGMTEEQAVETVGCIEGFTEVLDKAGLEFNDYDKTIKEKKIPESLTGWVGGFSKEQQIGKGGKK